MDPSERDFVFQEGVFKRAELVAASSDVLAGLMVDEGKSSHKGSKSFCMATPVASPDT